MPSENQAGSTGDSASPAPPAQKPGRPSWRSQLQAALVTLLPGTLQAIVEKGLLRAFAWLLLALFVLPLLVVFLAAFWLRQLAGIDHPAAQALRQAYLEVIAEGFSIEEVASRANVRLDYLQLFDYDLRPRTAPSKDLRIAIHPRQKAALDFRLVTFKSDERDCSLPEEDIPLVSVFLDEQLVRTLGEDANVTVELGRNWWQAHQGSFESGQLIQKLSFRLTDPAKKLPCGKIHLEGSVRVFKDLLPSQPTQD